MVVRKIIILCIGLTLSSHAMAQTDWDEDVTRTFFNTNKTYTILEYFPGSGDGTAISCENSFMTIRDEFIHIRHDDNTCYNFARIVGDVKEYLVDVSSLWGEKSSYSKWLYYMEGGGAISVARNQHFSQRNRKDTYFVSIYNTRTAKLVIMYKIIDNTKEIE